MQGAAGLLGPEGVRVGVRCRRQLPVGREAAETGAGGESGGGSNTLLSCSTDSIVTSLIAIWTGPPIQAAAGGAAALALHGRRFSNIQSLIS